MAISTKHFYFVTYLPKIRTHRLVRWWMSCWHERLWTFPQKWFPRSKIILHVGSISKRTSSTFQFPLAVRFKCKNAVHYPYRLSSLEKIKIKKSMMEEKLYLLFKSFTIYIFYLLHVRSFKRWQPDLLYSNKKIPDVLKVLESTERSSICNVIRRFNNL